MLLTEEYVTKSHLNDLSIRKQYINSQSKSEHQQYSYGKMLLAMFLSQ